MGGAGGKVARSRTGPHFVCWNIDASENRGFFWRNLSAAAPYGAQLARQAAALGAAQEAGNVKPFLTEPAFGVLEEGSVYCGAWIETQPMGGAMWATRDVRAALNNQLVFTRSQRSDGRYPHRTDGCASRGWCCHLGARHYISVVVTHKKCKKGHLNDSTTHG